MVEDHHFFPAIAGRGAAVTSSAVFVAATFILTWLAWAASARCGHASLVFGIGGPVFLLGVSAPALVALAITLAREGGPGVRDLLRPVTRWSLGPWWYIAALLYLPVIKVSAAGVHRLVTGAWPPFGDVNIVPIALGIAVGTWVQAGEEIGWRGYLLPGLQHAVGLRLASIFVGVIWAGWHLPLFFIAGTGSTGQSFPLYMFYATALSVAMAWAFSRTGSLLLVMFMHASVNNTSAIVRVAAPGASDPWAWTASTAAWAMVAIAWAVSAVLLARMPARDPGPGLQIGLRAPRRARTPRR